MEMLYIVSSILQSLAVSLGVGASTIAIAQFLVSISDGNIEKGERRIMGVVYLWLRVAMVLIVLTSLAQSVVLYKFIGLQMLNPFSVGIWVITLVLFLNAIGMTKHLIPSTLGPGIQAGSWYSLGILLSLVPLGLTTFTYLQFGLVYAGFVLLAIALVNIMTSRLRG